MILRVENRDRRVIDGTVRLWDLDAGRERSRLRAVAGRSVRSLGFAADGRTLATVSDTAVLRFWEVEAGEVAQEARSLRGHTDGAHAFTTTSPGALIRWIIATWSIDAEVDTGLPLGSILAITPDGSMIVTGNRSGMVRFFSTATLRERMSPPANGHKGLTSSIQFSPDGRTMATASVDGSVRLWDWRAGTVTAVLEGHQGWIGSVAFSPDGRRLLAGGQDGTVTFWSLPDLQDLVSFRRHPDHNRVLRVTLDGEVSEFIAFGNIVPTGLAVHGDAIYMAEAGPVPHLPQDGRVVVFGARPSLVTEVASGAPLLVDVEFSRGRTLYALSQGVFPGGNPAEPASPDTGALLEVNSDGSLSVIVSGLDRPTSVEIIRNTAYVITLGGEIWKIEDVSGPPFGRGR